MSRSLVRSIESLEASVGDHTRDELVQIRRELADTVRALPIQLPNLKVGFECTQRWETMAGDDRVRACAGCDRPVFNLSAMTRADAVRLLATRGLTPCVRFYRRPDGTVMTADCPTGERRERRKRALVAGSLAAGAVLAMPGAALAEDGLAPPTVEEEHDRAFGPLPASTGDGSTPGDPSGAHTVAPDPPIVITDQQPVILMGRMVMGIPISDSSLHVIPDEPDAPHPPRPRFEWSIWGRLGTGIHSHALAAPPPHTLARTVTPPPSRSDPSQWEAAIGADITLGVAHDGDVRLGAWVEARTTTGLVVGGELAANRIGGNGFVLRVGGNTEISTIAVGVGASFGGRIIGSINQSLADPFAWSALIGVELEAVSAVRAVFRVLCD